MRHLALVEHQTRRGVRLTRAECAALQTALPGVVLAPARSATGVFDVTPGSRVGIVAPCSTLTVEILPKLPIQNILFLVSYALDPSAWRNDIVDLDCGASLVEAVVPVFAAHVRRALRHGLLQGYCTEEATLQTVRGRLRVDEQVRHHHGRCFPAEVRYDELTEDILENRLLKAAIARLSRLPLRSPQAASLVRHLGAPFARVTPVQYPAQHVPVVPFSWLNDRYRPAVELARLILRASSPALGRGDVTGLGFLMDMNRVFEDFVVIALRVALGLTCRSFPQGNSGRSLTLDGAGSLPLKPDLTWWEGDRCAFAGDVKYKQTAEGKHEDLYQLLAYVTAADLPGGLLIYAGGAAGAEDDVVPVMHEIVQAGKTLHVTALDLAGSPQDILAQINLVARRVRRLKSEARVAA